jgi:lipopolysaccharide transport system permease protein
MSSPSIAPLENTLPPALDPPAEPAPNSEAAEKVPVLVIEPTPGWKALNLRELWQFRELLWFLAMRDIKVRYKQTVLGVAWAVLQPLLTMVVFTIFFGRLGGFDQKTGGIPYPVFSLCALVPWQLFAYALTQSSSSVVAEQRLLTKVYFPRLIIPLAPTLSGLVDFAISFGLLLVLMAFYGVWPTLAVLLLPIFVVFALLAALAVALWLSALNAIYRDVRYTIPFLTQFWLFATPIAYPSTIVPADWQWLYGLNPMVGVIEGFRWCLLDLPEPPWTAMAASAVVVVLLLVGGLYYFRRMEKTFADVV